MKNGIRGSDGRMAYTEDLEEAIKIVAEWTSRKGTPAEFFMSFGIRTKSLVTGIKIKKLLELTNNRFKHGQTL